MSQSRTGRLMPLQNSISSQLHAAPTELADPSEHVAISMTLLTELGR